VEQTTAFQNFLNVVRPIIPVLGLILVIPVLWLMFRKTWRELDLDSQKARGELLERGKSDLRPYVALPLCAIILTLQEYYGGRGYFEQVVHPLITKYDLDHHDVLRTFKYEELWGFAWWSGTRALGYVIVPFVAWKIAFPRDSLLDLGLRTKGFFHHVWIYGLFLLVVLPPMWLVSHEPDFGGYYPFYRNASRSWADFLMWEAMYFAQFFALEIFFRGFWLGVLRKSMGSGAIFAMAVPYCMIHYGKPFFEACGAIVAGIALGSLSMRTKSIYQGFLVHITVAGLMDWLALHNRKALPKVIWAPDVDTTGQGSFITDQGLKFAHQSVLAWSLLGAVVLGVMIFRVVQARRQAREEPTPRPAESAPPV
jgi:membrane protease YdiL (CAAX protease family)